MGKDLPHRGAVPFGARPWTVNGAGQRPAPPAMLPPLDTRYQFTWLTPEGGVEDGVRMGPSTPLFTDAFTALARGSLILTANGSIAVEDLLPGDRIITAAGHLPLMWKGSRIIAPHHRGMALHRIASEALGPSRPLPDLVVGPAARIVSRRTALRSLIGADAALVPVTSLVDDEAVVRIRPISAMQVFHLGFERHTVFTANGVELESVHPGRLPDALGREMYALYHAMFPHLLHVGGFGELSMARLQGEALRRLTAVA